MPERWYYMYVSDAESLLGQNLVEQALRQGWEPFAATDVEHGTLTVHLRMFGPSDD